MAGVCPTVLDFTPTFTGYIELMNLCTWFLVAPGGFMCAESSFILAIVVAEPGIQMFFSERLVNDGHGHFSQPHPKVMTLPSRHRIPSSCCQSWNQAANQMLRLEQRQDVCSFM